MLEQAILYSSLILDPIAATVFLWLLICSNHRYMRVKFTRLACVIACIGLYGQTLRSGVAITTGIAPRDDELAWWFGKDLGLVMFSLFLLWEKFKPTQR